MRYTRRIEAFTAILGLAIAPIVVGSCAKAYVDCSKRGFDATFVGRLTAMRTATAIFAMESVQAVRHQGEDAHTPTAGATVAVHYAEGQERLLRVGDRYRVGVVWNGREFESGVHVADDPCSGGTTHADGSAIRTTRESLLTIRDALIALAIAPLVALLVLIAWIGNGRRRRRALVHVGGRLE
ncbi:MAG: hypothetical protein M3Q30_06565 [Actinomycetota bacterium]|nr:hypothetical protein [Actinomycetota bacterium]